jgi:hypothetical protein
MLEKVFATRVTENYNNTGKVSYSSGYYWDSESYFISNDNTLKLKKIIDTIYNTKIGKIKEGSIFYASKASEIPRFKLKEFIKDNKLKKTSRHAYAEYILINKSFINELNSQLNIEDIIFFKENFVVKHFLSNPQSNWGLDKQKDIYIKAEDRNKVAYLKPSTIEDVKQLFKKYPADKPIFEANTSVFSGVEISAYRNIKLYEVVNLLFEHEENILNGKIKFIFDEEFFTDLNKDGIELDDEYLNILRDMLFSEDKDNIKLGFEMMSNLVINDHTLLSISFLLNELYHEHNFRHSQYTQSNTNLKGLLSLLKTKGIKWDHDWKSFGSGLRLAFKEGKEGEIVKKFLLDNINREFKLSNSASEALVDIVFAT